MRRPLVVIGVFFTFLLWVIMEIRSPWWKEHSFPEGERYLSGVVSQKEEKVQNDKEILILTLTEVSILSDKIILNSTDGSVHDPENYRQLNKTENALHQVEGTLQKDLQIPCYMSEGCLANIGSRVVIKGKLTPYERASNPGEFDLKKYYQILKRPAALYQADMIWYEQTDPGIRERLYQVKKWIVEKIAHYLESYDLMLLRAVLLGERGGIDADTKENYQLSGMLHILSISGLHIAFLGDGIYRLLRRLSLPKTVAGVISAVIMLLYGNMVGFGISTMRAIVMFLVRIGADLIGRSYDLLSALFFSLVMNLADNPLYLYHSGFLYSFGAVVSLVSLSPLIQEMLPLTKGNLKLLRRSGVVSVLAIFLGLLPLQIYFYKRLVLSSIVVNLLVVPCMSGVLVLGILLILSSVLVSGTAPLFAFLIHLAFSFFRVVSEGVSGMVTNKSITGAPSRMQIGIYYAGLLFVFILVKSKGIKKYSAKKRCILYVISLFLCMTVLFYKPSAGLEICAINVGQGDCFYVSDHQGHDFLIDGGSTDVNQVGLYRIHPFLMAKGVQSLDGIFISHLDKDHYCGILELIEESTQGGVAISAIYLPAGMFSENSQAFCLLDAMCKDAHIPLIGIGAGDHLTYPDLSIQCLYPERVGEMSEDKNENSMVLLIEQDDFQALFTGDLEGEGEQLLTENWNTFTDDSGLELLKVAHHGSKNSTSVSFLDAVSPAVGIISAGENNRYGHPHAETIERLQAAQTQIFETAKEGAITVFVKNGQIKLYSYY